MPQLGSPLNAIFFLTIPSYYHDFILLALLFPSLLWEKWETNIFVNLPKVVDKEMASLTAGYATNSPNQTTTLYVSACIP